MQALACEFSLFLFSFDQCVIDSAPGGRRLWRRMPRQPNQVRLTESTCREGGAATTSNAAATMDLTKAGRIADERETGAAAASSTPATRRARMHPSSIGSMPQALPHVPVSAAAFTTPVESA